MDLKMLEEDYDPVVVMISIYSPAGKDLFKVNNKDTRQHLPTLFNSFSW